MLTNDDKERIHQEEVYRLEVRTQLDKASHTKTKKGEKVWTLINSAFFLWFLSSVVLGSLSLLYAWWDNKRTIEREEKEKAALIKRENMETEKRLDNEITSRLNYFIQSQEIRLSEGEEFGSSDGSKFGISYARLSEEGIKSLDDTSAAGYKINVYSEYANRNMNSLLIDLKNLVLEEKKNEVEFAHKQLIESQPMFLKAMEMIKIRKKSGEPGYVIVDKSFGDEAVRLKKLCISFNLERWGSRVPLKLKHPASE